MARFFDVKPVATSIELDEQRTGQAAFTVTNATSASIRGDNIVVPQGGSEAAKYELDEQSLPYKAGASNQVVVTVTVPPEVKPGTYGFLLRVLLGGGVPEEQFDDSAIVQYVVHEIATPPPPPPPPPPKPFPWWIIAVIAVIAVLVIGGIVAFVVTRPQPTGWPPPGDILASDAPNHVGEHQTVCGTVVATNWVFADPGHPTWLNFDQAYPNVVFNGLIWGEQRRAWPIGNPEGSGKPEVIYLNKKVCVTGTIEHYKTWYQIQDLTTSDIVVVP